MRIVLTAGGTGGHIYPALAFARALADRGHQIYFIGSQVGLEKKILLEKQNEFIEFIQTDFLKISGVRRKGLKAWLKLPIKLFLAICSARKILKKNKIALVIAFGGFASGPCGLAAKTLGIPLWLHEQNAIFGLTNKILSIFSDQIFLGFEIKKNKKIHWVGNPIRKEILALGAAREKNFFLKKIDDTNEKNCLKILITGGSQGARIFNRIFPCIFKILSDQGLGECFFVKHQTGIEDLEKTKELYLAMDSKGQRYQTMAYLNPMAEAYAWADLVICRAGALTVCEVAAAGLPGVFIPSPYVVDDHQRKNAENLVSAGGGYLINQKDLSEEILITQLVKLLEKFAQPDQKNILQQQGYSAYQWVKKDAVETMLSFLSGI